MPRDRDDQVTPGELLAHYRERAGLTHWGLVAKSGITSQHGAYIRDFEHGLRVIPRRRFALAYARAMGLDPWETDRFLYAWGFAPVLDWQQAAEALLIDAGYGDTFRRATAALYRQTTTSRGDTLDDT